ncbi:MAG: hypothetical protein A2W91_18320 [Bacteroidetes bacterium GWF2_38_335]|nr:MAG: hypothetical protein A2W91_18320 [Bacteroidetes bacterium GWF2_38_335]OFY80079.1 MAG: hypothetical protein A2281_12315 [Bacteroidetes bacterium RIFOXYA12_FULL_38_20]HBS88596.1 hypothetical protein [Bacteroidales bacterium]
MKTTIEHLPVKNRNEINGIVSVLRSKLPAQMIILFGSYARGEQVNDKYVEDGITYEYQSDYDILVVMDSESHAVAKEAEKRWWHKLKTVVDDTTPLSIIFHGIEFLNAEIEQGNYFFTDILKEGVLLYDSGKHKLSSPLPLNEKQRKDKARMYFEKWFKNANMFFGDFEANLLKGAQDQDFYKLASFLLHQATERFYMTVLLVHTDYKPKIHDLDKLDKMVCKLDSRFKTVFPRTTVEEKRLFDLLKRAYIDSRYKLDYEIKKEELEWLGERVGVLREMVEGQCECGGVIPKT